MAAVSEVIIVDGGSRDETVSLGRSLGFRVERCAGGRGAQLNLGAQYATSPILLFLHADTRLPPDFPRIVTRCLASPDTILGAFRLQVDVGGLFLKSIIGSANLRSRLLQLPYGDQALFLCKKDFEKLGGFPELPIMEDYVFVRRAGQAGKIVTLPEEVITSGRRWQRLGPLRTTLLNQLIVCAWHLGVSPKTLASIYRRGSLIRWFRGNEGTKHGS